MTRTTKSQLRFSVLLPVAVVWLIVAGLLVVSFWPSLPSTWLQWVLLIAFGPPIYVIGEELFGWVFSPDHGAAISNRRFSLKRILFGFVVVSICLSIALGLVWLGGYVAA